MSEKSAEGLVHHYMRGIRFDGLWEYQVKNASGRLRWSHLPMDDADTNSVDPEGLGWCLSRCLSVLSQQPFQIVSFEVSRLLALKGEAAEWNLLIYGRSIRYAKMAQDNGIGYLATLLTKGGCALLKLELMRKRRQQATIVSAWMWMIGLEQIGIPQDSHVTTVVTDRDARAVLLVGLKVAAPWASGYGARLSRTADGGWVLRSTDGHSQHVRCIAMVSIE